MLLKSVFTHMLPAAVTTYTSEISRVLKKGGRAVVTYFLLNAESRRFVDQNLDVHGSSSSTAATLFAASPIPSIRNASSPTTNNGFAMATGRSGARCRRLLLATGAGGRRCSDIRI